MNSYRIAPKEAFRHQHAAYGEGKARCHHGEILQGIFEGPSGVMTPGLVSLLINRVGACVRFYPDQCATDVTVVPKHKSKALKAASLTLRMLGKPDLVGTLQIETYVDEKCGFGSSTADVVATCYAVADALGQEITPQQVAQISVASELATDPLMHRENTLLFAQREGRIIEVLGPPMPRFGLLSFTLGPPVSTCSFQPPKYTHTELEKFEYLRGMLKDGINDADLNLIGQVGLLSAEINQGYLIKPRFDSIVSIIEKLGFPGLQIAHSGNLIGILFDDHDPDKTERIQEAKQRLAKVGVRNVVIAY